MTYCYISGPITDMPELNRPAFSRAAQALRAHGYTPINPFDICPSPASWREAMNADIKFLVGCDYIVMLPGWRRSKGARLELHIARELGIQAMPLPPIETRPSMPNRAKGGNARAANLSPERRREIASKAAKARWSREPHASAATT